MNRLNKLAAFGLAVIVSAGTVFPVLASDEEIENAQYELESTQEDLDEVRQTIDDLEVQKEALTGEIDDLQSKLVRTISGIETLNREVGDLTVQMEQTTADLAVAEEDKDIQYQAMKKRIQYLYEMGGDAGWATVFLSGGDLSDLLDKAEYTQQMYNYDRNQLEEYMSIIDMVEALQTQQYEDKSALETRKHEQEEAQLWLQSLLSEAENEYDDYETKIAEAYEMAEEYRALITAQNEAIAQLIAAQAAQAALEISEEEASAAAQQIVEAYYAENNGAGAYTAAVSGAQNTVEPVYTVVEDAGTQSTEAEQNTVAEQNTEAQTDSGYTAAPSYNNYTSGHNISESSNTSSRGQAILEYAQQFVGNPYVYGGNSLTDGVDCSGFVQQVMANFGITTQRTSWEQETDGEAVSYNDVQVGDLIIYDGHSAIYAGDNQVINAIDEAHGIGYSNVDSGQIVAIRRLVQEDAPAESTYTESYDETNTYSYAETASGSAADTYADTASGSVADTYADTASGYAADTYAESYVDTASGSVADTSENAI